MDTIGAGGPSAHAPIMIALRGWSVKRPKWRLLVFHKDTKERKGLGTSPFGPTGLSTVPIPCVSSVFLGSLKGIQNIEEV